MNTETLRYLWAPELNPLFWRPCRVGVASAWYSHIPFAHWIVNAVQPHTLVELGTDRGVSYSAFCEAVVRGGLNTRCYAVDTWLGDDQAGYYGEDVYLDLVRFHDDHYGAFSELLRCTFDSALPYIPDGTVDLLHIDGLHTYEAVKHDFESWQSKLSDKAVVLLHDTNVRERDFGVWRLWEKLRTQFPSFEFLHGHGLGVLAVGHSISPQVAALCCLDDPARVHAIRERFALLGERWNPDQGERSRQSELAARDARIVALEAELTRLKAKEEELAARDARILALQAEAARRAEAEAQLRARAAQRTAQARAETARALTRLAAVEAQTMARLLTGNAKIRLLYISGEPDTAGNTYRVVRYVEAAVAAGVQASWIRQDEIRKRPEQIAGIDILVIWRTAWNEQIAFAVETARKAGARIVFDIDDLLIDPGLDRGEMIDGIRTSGLTEAQWQEQCARFHETMVAADYCTTPTEELAANIRRFFLPALVLTNGFDHRVYQISRRAVRQRRSEKSDGLVRIGYTGGTPSHQRDFATAAEAIARVLRERPHCRLVLFRSQNAARTGVGPSVDLEEFPSFQGIDKQIEWHDVVPLTQLPEKVARFDINIAPLEVGNPFCEAKSELKFFEAALVDVPTVASPTGPFRRAIREGVTGFLADSSQEWYTKLLGLVDDPGLRYRIARAAHQDVLWHYGSLRRADAILSALPQLRGDSQAAVRAFALEQCRAQMLAAPTIHLPKVETAFEADKYGEAEVTVIMALSEYTRHVEEALESVRAQTLETLDLIVVDNAPHSAAVGWAQRNASRFNRVAVLRAAAETTLGAAWDAAIDAAATPFILPLDADHKLLPECVAECLSVIRSRGVAFAYPQIRRLAEDSPLLGNFPFEPRRFIDGGYIEATALVSKEGWAAVGGYGDFRGRETGFDFWSRLVKRGLSGSPVGGRPLAECRVSSI